MSKGTSQAEGERLVLFRLWALPGIFLLEGLYTSCFPNVRNGVILLSDAALRVVRRDLCESSINNANEPLVAGTVQEAVRRSTVR